MAGDIGIEESIAAPTAATLREASAAPPIPVLHDYGLDFRIRIGPAQATARAARPLNPQTLSENEQLGLAALQLREVPAIRRGQGSTSLFRHRVGQRG